MVVLRRWLWLREFVRVYVYMFVLVCVGIPSRSRLQRRRLPHRPILPLSATACAPPKPAPAAPYLHERHTRHAFSNTKCVQNFERCIHHAIYGLLANYLLRHYCGAASCAAALLPRCAIAELLCNPLEHLSLSTVHYGTCIMLRRNAVQCNLICCYVMHCTAPLCKIPLQCVAMHNGAMLRSVMHTIAVRTPRCTARRCIALYRTALYHTDCTAISLCTRLLCKIPLHCVAMHTGAILRSVMHTIAVQTPRCSAVHHCTALHCTTLTALQFPSALDCTALQYSAVWHRTAVLSTERTAAVTALHCIT